MEFSKTQIGQVLEQIKQAMLAHTPVVYIPTDQMEIVNDLLFGEACHDALVPRVYPVSDSVSEYTMEAYGTYYRLVRGLGQTMGIGG